MFPTTLVMAVLVMILLFIANVGKTKTIYSAVFARMRGRLALSVTNKELASFLRQIQPCFDNVRRCLAWLLIATTTLLCLPWVPRRASAQNAADTLVSERQARRAAEVSILKTQFRQQGGFTSDQLSGYYTALQLSNEANSDIKNGITRSANYYRMRSASINDYFQQQVLSRPTLLSDTDAAMVIWKTSLLFSPLKLGPALASQAGITDSGGIETITDAAKSTIETAASIYSHQFNPTKALANKDLIASLQTQAQQTMDNSLYTLFGKCDQAPASCQAIDELVQQMGRPSGLDPAIPFNMLAAQHPDVVPQSMRVGTDGSLHYDAQALASSAMAECLDLTQNGIKPDVDNLKQTSDPQLTTGFVQVVRGPAPAPSQVQTEADREKLRAAQIETTLKAVDFSAQLIGLVNPKLANEIQAVKQATVSTAQNISGYVAEVQKFKDLGSNASIVDSLKLAASSFDLASGLVGIGVQVFSMFGGGGSADDAILQEIRNLSAQIENLRTEMVDRFSRVDSEINDVMDTLHDAFAKIDYNQHVIIGNVDDIRTGLISIETKLDKLEQYLSRWLQDGQKDEFVRNINGCLGYKAKFGIDMPQSEFIRCETYFYTWVTTTALRDLFAGTDRTDFSDAGVADNINNYPLNVNVNWLSQFLAKNLGLSPLSPTPLPNLFEWTLGTQAYLQLLREWPQWAASVSPSDLNAIEQLGQSILQAVASGPTAGASANTPSPVFDALSAKYNAKVTALQVAIGGVEQSYVNDPATKVIDPAGRYKLAVWGGGVNQITGWRPPAGQSCGSLPVSLPDAFMSNLPSVLAVAEALGFGSADYCIGDPVWVNDRIEQPNCKYDPSPPRGSGAYCSVLPPLTDAPNPQCMMVDQSCSTRGCTPPPPICEPTRIRDLARLKFDVSLRFRGNVISVIPYLSKQEYVKSETQWHLWVGAHSSQWLKSDKSWAPADVVKEQWPTLSAEVMATPPTPTPANATEIQFASQQIDNVLRNHQWSIYSRIFSEFSGAGAVNMAAKQLAGFKGLICSFASLLLPQTMEQNEYVQSLCQGTQALFTDADVAAIYDAARTAPIPDTTKKVDFTGSALDRAAAFQDALKAIATKLVQKQTDERLDPVADVLDAIALYKAGNFQVTCTYAVRPALLQVPVSGGRVPVSVDTDASCPWAVVGLPSWAQSTGSGPGPGSASITVGPNIGAARSAPLTIATQPVTLSQDGTVSCSYAINPTSQSFPTGGGTGRIDVTAGTPCSWSATQAPTWITIASGASGSGNGSVFLTVAANSGAARSVTFTVAGLSFKVDQAGAQTCTYSVTPTSQAFPAAGGSGRIDVSTGSTCGWSVSGLPHGFRSLLSPRSPALAASPIRSPRIVPPPEVPLSLWRALPSPSVRAPETAALPRR